MYIVCAHIRGSSSAGPQKVIGPFSSALLVRIYLSSIVDDYAYSMHKVTEVNEKIYVGGAIKKAEKELEAATTHINKLRNLEI